MSVRLAFSNVRLQSCSRGFLKSEIWDGSFHRDRGAIEGASAELHFCKAPSLSLGNGEVALFPNTAFKTPLMQLFCHPIGDYEGERDMKEHPACPPFPVSAYFRLEIKSSPLLHNASPLLNTQITSLPTGWVSTSLLCNGFMAS